MIDEHYGALQAEVATLREKVRAIEESESSTIRRFIGKIDKNNSEIQVLRETQMEIKTILDGHINWSSQIPINYEKLNTHVRDLEQTVKDGFAELKTQIKGQDKDFDYFVRLPAKTVLLGALGVLGVAVAHSFMRVAHWVWDWWKAFSKANYL